MHIEKFKIGGNSCQSFAVGASQSADLDGVEETATGVFSIRKFSTAINISLPQVEIFHMVMVHVGSTGSYQKVAGR